MNIPRATYRLQFNEHFRLRDALALVTYLRELGVSHIYASPLLAACPHSTHGYDVCDFSRLNPDIGAEADLEKLIFVLKENYMGLVLDIVPNHMGIGTPENFWWWDVLQNGQTSEFADCFDIDWELPDPALRGKVLLPVLSAEYETVLRRGDLKIEPQNGDFVLRYGDHQFPLHSGSLPGGVTTEKLNNNLYALHELVQRQNYQPMFYGNPAAPNYRRFFAVNSLAAVRVETEEVFTEAHSLVQRWIDRKWLDGLRVDHPDGLREPQKYLERLRALAPDQWIVVEKILSATESLPKDWPVNGTTGYDFIFRVNNLFVDSTGGEKLSDFYSEFIGESLDYQALVAEKKRLVLNELFSGEVNRLARLIFEISNGRGKNYTLNQLHEVIKEFAVCLPVYRTYISVEKKNLTPVDSSMLVSTLNLVSQRLPKLPDDLPKFISDLMQLHFTGEREDEFVARFQQLTGAVMAKGVEDTAFYCYNRFTSLNEVGGNPEILGNSAKSFHEFCQRQLNQWPHSMLSTSTHDTKRSEDVRARLNVISEIPEQWAQTVRHWSAINEKYRVENWPDRNAEYFLYQSLAGAWPASQERILTCMEKAVREAGQHTTWQKPNAEYEKSLRHFITGALQDSEFTDSLQSFVAGICDAGYVNSLAQTLIKLTAPGAPDIYQGCELWDFSLMDPDNRRSVDFALRQKLLAEIKTLSAAQIWQRRAEGLPKMWLIQKTLACWQRLKKIFESDYELLFATGEKADHVFGFQRGQNLIIVVPRFSMQRGHWATTSLNFSSGRWQNEFTGEKFTGAVRLEHLTDKFPVALLTKMEVE